MESALVYAGQQLIWFSNHLAGGCIYTPAAIVGAVLPFRLAQRQQMTINTQVAGSCLFNAVLAVLLVVAGGKVAYSHALWSAAAYISLWIVPKVGKHSSRISQFKIKKHRQNKIT